MPQRSASHGVEESSLKRYPNHHERKSSTSLTDDYQAYLSLEAPAPPIHRDASSSTRSSSAGDSSSSVNKTVLPKSAVRKNQVSMLLNELDQIKLQSTQQASDLEHRHQELERAFLAKEKEYNKISTNFHQLVKTIRATDDDFSTIRVKLAMLQSKTAALPLSLKKYDASTSRDVFSKRWPALKADMTRLYDQRGAGATCILVEKLLFEVFIDRIFNMPVYIGLPTNAAYETIRQYMDPHDTDWSLRLRQQLCKLAAKSMQTNDQANQAIMAAKEALVKDLESLLGDIYTNECKDVLAGKVQKLVDIAADVSLAMHSQDTSVEPSKINEALLSDPDMMQSVDAFAADSSGQIRIVVSPPFIADEPSEKLVLLRGKGIVC
ncbi:hypothetical protein BCR43DRAFT_493461 [Syncephalastrum racemosum]|uniref:Uncharacterized protein n=1 Tax=Syncephalastrum racemosum TaxID=13706 RepID=A0A1X2HAK3_SYNRA|nr:hypothetical protein BCR43DRAFT_493461 [Syncephalastrum racemosum]